jgi:intracellular sulfur oxidation DsrE/DsrF family protein
MKAVHKAMLAAAIFTVSASAFAADADAANFWQTPALPGVGKMHPLPKAAYQPQQSVTYRIVFAVTKGVDQPGEVNPSLDRVARTVNLYASAGVPLDHMKFVAVLYGPATQAVLDNEHYRQQFGTDNPNLELIHKLRAAGVDVAVCGQAVAEHKFDYGWVHPDVTLALSALTTVSVLETQGYVLLPL